MTTRRQQRSLNNSRPLASCSLTEPIGSAAFRQAFGRARHCAVHSATRASTASSTVTIPCYTASATGLRTRSLASRTGGASTLGTRVCSRLPVSNRPRRDIHILGSISPDPSCAGARVRFAPVAVIAHPLAECRHFGDAVVPAFSKAHRPLRGGSLRSILHNPNFL